MWTGESSGWVDQVGVWVGQLAEVVPVLTGNSSGIRRTRLTLQNAHETLYSLSLSVVLLKVNTTTNDATTRGNPTASSTFLHLISLSPTILHPTQHPNLIPWFSSCHVSHFPLPIPHIIPCPYLVLPCFHLPTPSKSHLINTRYNEYNERSHFTVPFFSPT